ncbi:MAG: transporter, family, multidrug resistance protein [Alphaproteobacteria bacterium]|nr:transporter, family, multidrug resistance protein [Alphaproteobacteria bacterium]
MDQLTPREQKPPERWRLSHARRPPLAIAFAASVALMSGATMLYPVLPVIAADLAIDEARIGLVMVAFTAPAIVLAPLFGIIADLHGRRWMLILGLALFGLAGAAAALAPSYGWLLACRAVQGIGMSAISPLTIVLISDLLSEDDEIHGQGFKVALDRVAMILLPLAGGILAAVSWRAAFLPYLLVLPLALAAFVWMPETNTPGAGTLRQYLARTARAVREPRLRLAFATGFLRFFLDFGLYTYLPILLVLRYGVSPATAGWVIAASAVGSILTAMSIGHVRDRYPVERFLAAAFCASALALAIIALGLPLWLLALACFAFGLGNGLISPLQKSLLTRRTPANLRGGVVSVDRVIQQVAKSLAPALMGLLLLVADLDAVFWCLCAMSAAGTLALIWVDATRLRE